MHEILTLQLGHRANHLATHFWNTQESYFTYDSTQERSPVDHDIHFRPGVGARGEETYTPRTLIYDLKGGFGGLRKWGGLYDQQQLGDGPESGGATGVWDGKVVHHTDPQISQSDYQRELDEGSPTAGKLTSETVRYWSDFNRVFYHPRSIVQINDYELNSSLLPFEKWENGEELFVRLDHDDDLLDRDVRVWAEECDQMQGIQMFACGDDAWGGFASKYVEVLRDEYGKMPIWTWGIEEQRGKGQRQQQLLRAVNAARTIDEMSRHASLYIPMSIPSTPLPTYVRLDRDSQWHTSALMSVALESMTLPARLRVDTQRRGLLGDLEAALNVNGNQRIAQLECSILDPKEEPPKATNDFRIEDSRAPSNTNYTMLEEDGPKAGRQHLDIDLSGGDIRPTSAFTSQHHTTSHIFGAVENTRGDRKVVREEEADSKHDTHATERRRFAGLTVVERYNSPLEYPLLDSFPGIFTLRPYPTSVAVHSSLSTTSRISNRVKALQKTISKMADVDEREALVNGLGEIGEAYEEGWNSGSDGDRDD